MIWALAATLLSAEAPPARQVRFIASLSGAAVLAPVGLSSDTPFAMSVNLGSETFSLWRVLVAVGVADLGGVTDSGPPRSASPWVSTGVEVVVPPLLPVELAPAASLGVQFRTECSGDTCSALRPAIRAQLRLTIGYRFLDWLSAGIDPSWTVLPGTRGPLGWFELGVRMTLRL